MKSLFIDKIEHLILKDTAYPELIEDSAIIKIKFSGICGSDIHVYHGKQPRVHPPTKFISGHEASGIIYETKSRILNKGDRVAIFPYKSCGSCKVCQEGNPQLCNQREFLGFQRDGTFAEYVLVPDDDVFLVPDTITLKEAAFIEPFAVAIHAVELSVIKKERCLIVGGGTIGLCIGIALREVYGVDNILFIEIQENRCNLIQKNNFKCFSDIHSCELGSIDTVFECSGSDLVLKSLLALHPPVKEMVIVSTFPREKNIPIFELIKKEIITIGSQAYQKNDFKKSLNCIANNNNIKQHIFEITEPREFSLEEANEAFVLATSSDSKPKVMFKIQ